MGENEPLLMADGQDEVHPLGQGDQRIGFFDAGRDRLLHQHMGAGVEEGAHDLGMGHGRRGHADQIHLAQQLAPVGNRGHAMGCGRILAHLGRRIGDGQQLDAIKGAILRGMMAAERAGADYGGLEQAILRSKPDGRHRKFPEITGT